MQAIARLISGDTRAAYHLLPQQFSLSAANLPKLNFRPHSPATQKWLGRQQAHYYFDASQQTSKALRTLIHNHQQNRRSHAVRADDELLVTNMHSLLASLKPGCLDDGESRRHYLQLCRLHLSGLTSGDIEQLQASLKQSKFQCYVTESVIDDDCYREYGFSNGPLHCHQRTLLQTTDFYHLLDDLKQAAIAQEAAGSPSASLSAAQAQELRDVLTDAASFWAQSDQPLAAIQDTACRLALACGVKLPADAMVAELPNSSSTVGWHEGRLLIQPQVVLRLQSEQHEQLYARILRDMMELFLIQKLTGTTLQSQALAKPDRNKALHAIEQVTEQCSPSIANGTLRQQAAAVMQHAAQFGQIHIKPGTGSLLGHAWIAPDLSLMPNNLAPAKEIGKRYMHTGFQLEPGEIVIREWPARFLSATENAEIHPEEASWQVRVPVNALKLRMAANEAKQEWQEKKIPYRFTGTEPGMPGTGCRMIVWHALQKSMDADARALFQHYNRGLVEPDSPVELWLRLQGFTEWVEQLAAS